MIHLIGWLLLLWAPLALAGEAPPDVRVALGQGLWLNWTQGTLEAESSARPSGVEAALRAVEQQARRGLGPRIAAGARQVPVTAELSVADLERDASLGQAIRSRLERWRVVEARYHTSGRVELLGELPLPELLRPWSFAVASEARDARSAPWTGLVIDARRSGVRPVFAPRLVSEAGVALHEFRLWEDAAFDRVPVVWVSHPAHPAATVAGEAPFFLLAHGARGADLVLTEAEAERFREALTGTRLLGEGVVVVVVDP